MWDASGKISDAIIIILNANIVGGARLRDLHNLDRAIFCTKAMNLSARKMIRFVWGKCNLRDVSPCVGWSRLNGQYSRHYTDSMVTGEVVLPRKAMSAINC